LKNAKKGKQVKNQKQNFKTEKNRKQNKWEKKESQKGGNMENMDLSICIFLFSRQKVIQNNSYKNKSRKQKNTNGQVHFPFFPFLTFLFFPFILLLRLWDFADLLLGCYIFVFACLSFFSSWLILRISYGLVNINLR